MSQLMGYYEFHGVVSHINGSIFKTGQMELLPASFSMLFVHHRKVFVAHRQSGEDSSFDFVGSVTKGFVHEISESGMFLAGTINVSME